jgi:hypothetical protein
MTNDKPVLAWQPQNRFKRVLCGMCSYMAISPDVASARAHVWDNPTHVVALVTMCTTLLSMSSATHTVVETAVSITGAEVFRE